MGNEMNVEFLLEWRKKYGLTQVKAAEQLGMSVNTYRKYEKGERVFEKNLLKKVSNKSVVFDLLFWLDSDKDDALPSEEERLPFADGELPSPEEDIDELPFSDESDEPEDDVEELLFPEDDVDELLFPEDDADELPFPETPEEKMSKKRRDTYRSREPVSRRLCSFKIKSVRCRNGCMTQWFLPCVGDRCMSYQDGRCVRVK